MKKQTEKQHKNLKFLIGIISIIVVIGLFIMIQTYRDKQLQLERQLQEIKIEKEFCDGLQLGIRGVSQGPGFGWVGVNFCIYSNQNTQVKLKTRFKDGKTLEEDKSLRQGSCMMEQLSTAIVEGEWKDYISYDSISYIEVTSEKCPNVRDIITDMDEIKPY